MPKNPRHSVHLPPISYTLIPLRTTYSLREIIRQSLQPLTLNLRQPPYDHPIIYILPPILIQIRTLPTNIIYHVLLIRLNPTTPHAITQLQYHIVLLNRRKIICLTIIISLQLLYPLSIYIPSSTRHNTRNQRRTAIRTHLPTIVLRTYSTSLIRHQSRITIQPLFNPIQCYIRYHILLVNLILQNIPQEYPSRISSYQPAEEFLLLILQIKIRLGIRF